MKVAYDNLEERVSQRTREISEINDKLREEISERHRHRYEFNNRYRETLEQAGLTLSGTSADGSLVEVVEIADHPWFVACQFHPEFKSRPLEPHPLFAGFIRASCENRDRKKGADEST